MKCCSFNSVNRSSTLGFQNSKFRERCKEEVIFFYLWKDVSLIFSTPLLPSIQQVFDNRIKEIYNPNGILARQNGAFQKPITFSQFLASFLYYIIINKKITDQSKIKFHEFINWLQLFIDQKTLNNILENKSDYENYYRIIKFNEDKNESRQSGSYQKYQIYYLKQFAFLIKKLFNGCDLSEVILFIVNIKPEISYWNAHFIELNKILFSRFEFKPLNNFNIVPEYINLNKEKEFVILHLLASDLQYIDDEGKNDELTSFNNAIQDARNHDRQQIIMNLIKLKLEFCFNKNSALAKQRTMIFRIITFSQFLTVFLLKIEFSKEAEFDFDKLIKWLREFNIKLSDNGKNVADIINENRKIYLSYLNKIQKGLQDNNLQEYNFILLIRVATVAYLINNTYINASLKNSPDIKQLNFEEIENIAYYYISYILKKRQYRISRIIPTINLINSGNQTQDIIQ